MSAVPDAHAPALPSGSVIGPALPSGSVIGPALPPGSVIGPALPPGSVIGILGGGQLGRMSALAAARLGYRCHVLTEEADGPAAQVCAAITLGSHADPAVLRRFADAVSVVTFEFENISADGLELLASLRPVRPSAAILRTSQDRILEKRMLEAAGIPVAPWHAVPSRDALDAAADRLGLPMVLKTTRLGYDGRGQAVAHDPQALHAAFDRLAPHPLVAEALVPFAAELSVIVARGLDGTIRTFDAVQNHHRNHILDLTLAPAPVGPERRAAAQSLAARIAAHLDLVGLLGVEMFLDAQGVLLVNEIAPRPHNSGHWTLDACPVSQFEMHIRAVAGLTLPPAVRHSDAVMKNLVGPDDVALWPQIMATDGLLGHLYGKREARPGRKMGHVNRLFARDALPGRFGLADALGVLAAGDPDEGEGSEA